MHKLESATITNVSDVLFAYNTASNDMLAVPQTDLPKGEISFVNKVKKALHDKVIMFDHFNTFSSTKALWALSRFESHKIAPSYHLDAGNVLMSRADLSKVSSVSHGIYRDIIK